MIGYHAVPEIADAYLKGVPGIDAGRALDAMTAGADTFYGHFDGRMRLGYVLVDHDGRLQDGGVRLRRLDLLRMAPISMWAG